MENKSSNENKVSCRKCGGPHFTIKCGKEKKEEPTTNESDSKIKNPDSKSNGDKEYKPRENRQDRQDRQDRPDRPRGDRHGDRYGDRPRGDKKYFKTTYRVKLSALPIDITEEEMMELTTDWGHIVRIKVLVYTESATAYIDFGYEDEAEYFVESIDKTPFEYKLISACRVESFRNEKTYETTTDNGYQLIPT